jgi:hypothetical protein
MGRHTASISIRCSRCGSGAQRVFSAESYAGGIRFNSSFRCPQCHLTEELDGPSLSDDARDAFYAAEGRWEASVRDLGPHRVEALRAAHRRRFSPTTSSSLGRRSLRRHSTTVSRSPSRT